MASTSIARYEIVLRAKCFHAQYGLRRRELKMKASVFAFAFVVVGSMALLPCVARADTQWFATEHKWASNVLGITLYEYYVYNYYNVNGVQVTYCSQPWGNAYAYLGWGVDSHGESIYQWGPSNSWVMLHGQAHYSFGVWIFKITGTLDCWMQEYASGQLKTW